MGNPRGALTELFELGHHPLKILDLGDDGFEIGCRKIYSFKQRQSVSNLICIFHSVLLGYHWDREKIYN